MVASKINYSAVEDLVMSESRLIPSTPFGVHQDPETGTWWLLEDNKARSAIGLGPGYCPFELATKNCPHRFNFRGGVSNPDFLSDFVIMMQVHSPSFVQNLTPWMHMVNRIHLVIVRPEHYPLARILTRISAPFYEDNIQDLDGKKYASKLQLTSRSNIGHYVLHNVTQDYADFATKLVTMARTLDGKMTMLGTESIVLTGLRGHYGESKFEDYPGLVELCNKWRDRPELFKEMGEYFLWHKMRDSSVMREK